MWVEEGTLGERQAVWTRQDISAGLKSKIPVRYPSGDRTGTMDPELRCMAGPDGRCAQEAS